MFLDFQHDFTHKAPTFELNINDGWVKMLFWSLILVMGFICIDKGAMALADRNVKWSLGNILPLFSKDLKLMRLAVAHMLIP
jgi:hypothetical protein